MRHAMQSTLVLLTGCAGGMTQVAANQEYQLAPGIEVSLTGADRSVAFVAMVNDSRCPSDVVCVTAGNAEVRLRLRGGGVDSTLSLNTTTPPKEATIGGVRLELVGLEPYPKASVPKVPADYRATIRWSPVR